MNQQFDGYKVLIHMPAPKMQLSADCPVSDYMRAATNAWLVEFFGYKPDPIIDDGEVIILHASKELIMSHKTWSVLFKHLKVSSRVF